MASNNSGIIVGALVVIAGYVLIVREGGLGSAIKKFTVGKPEEQQLKLEGWLAAGKPIEDFLTSGQGTSEEQNLAAQIYNMQTGYEQDANLANYLAAQPNDWEGS